MSAIPKRLVARVRSTESSICGSYLRPISPQDFCPWLCQRTCFQPRNFSTSAPLHSGHSKWATIKHDKGKNDAAKNKQRSIFSRDITNASRLFGSDPNANPRLALAISLAKKAGVPKAVIETAVARGQGVSVSGAALESVTVEAMLPPSIATVIDCQTDNKLRALADIRLVIKEHEGNVTPTNYLFEKKGRIIFAKKEGVGVDEVLEEALEAGALNVVENEEGKVVVFTEANETKAAAETLSKTLELEIQESEIIWDPNKDTQVGIDNEAATNLTAFLGELQEVSGVQGVYMNFARGDVVDELWSDLRTRVVI